MKLIYHPINTPARSSPFEDAVHSMAKKSGEILLVCPYINLKYLKKIAGLAENWRLLTDVEVLIDNSKEKFSMRNFIGEHEECIKHIKNIHAKVFITKSQALLGSANLTKKGFAERDEMSIILDDMKLVKELLHWFDSLWKVGEFAEAKKLDLFMKRNKERFSTNKEQNKLARVFKSDHQNHVFTSGTFFTSKKNEQNVAYERQLIKAIQSLQRSREWIGQYFDLVKDLLVE